MCPYFPRIAKVIAGTYQNITLAGVRVPGTARNVSEYTDGQISKKPIHLQTLAAGMPK